MDFVQSLLFQKERNVSNNIFVYILRQMGQFTRTSDGRGANFLVASPSFYTRMEKLLASATCSCWIHYKVDSPQIKVMPTKALWMMAGKKCYFMKEQCAVIKGHHNNQLLWNFKGSKKYIIYLVKMETKWVQEPILKWIRSWKTAISLEFGP